MPQRCSSSVKLHRKDHVRLFVLPTCSCRPKYTLASQLVCRSKFSAIFSTCTTHLRSQLRHASRKGIDRSSVSVRVRIVRPELHTLHPSCTYDAVVFSQMVVRSHQIPHAHSDVQRKHHDVANLADLQKVQVRMSPQYLLAMQGTVLLLQALIDSNQRQCPSPL